MAKFAVCDRGVLGAFMRFETGPYVGMWRFIPWVQRQPSRKNWPTAFQALPRWAKDADIIDATDAAAALRAYGENTNRTLAGRVCALSHAFAYDSAPARTLTEASEKLRALESA